jgi:hypothetical protein
MLLDGNQCHVSQRYWAHGSAVSGPTARQTAQQWRGRCRYLGACAILNVLAPSTNFACNSGARSTNHAPSSPLLVVACVAPMCWQSMRLPGVMYLVVWHIEIVTVTAWCVLTTSSISLLAYTDCGILEGIRVLRVLPSFSDTIVYRHVSHSVCVCW